MTSTSFEPPARACRRDDRQRGFHAPGRAPHALLALVLGTTATIEGLGVTAVHLARGAAIDSHLLGLASLTAGLLLLVLGGASLVRAIQGWWRVLALPVVLGWLMYLVLPLTFAVNATHPPRTPITGPSPAESGVAFHDVALDTSDGVRLAGWYIPSQNRAAVLALPGGGGSRSGVLDAALVLASQGYGVLALDHRGHGLSGGTPMDFGWFGDRDVDAAISFLVARPDVDPQRVGVLGFSMGGEEGLTAAASDDRIRAVVSDGGTHRVFDDLRVLRGESGFQTALMPFYWVTTQAPRLMTSAPPPMPLADAARRIAPRPVLLISASEWREATLSTHLQSMAPTSTVLWIVPDTLHTQAIRTHPTEWSSRVLDFFNQALIR